MDRVLWIEDGALLDFTELAASVLVAGEYELVISTNASNAVNRLIGEQEPFDAVIVDIRIPPGDRREWIQLDRRLGRDGQPRLGIELIKAVLGADDAQVRLARRPTWISPERLAVLTVETEQELRPLLTPLGVHLVFEKHQFVSAAEEDDPLLPRIIRAILAEQGRG